MVNRLRRPFATFALAGGGVASCLGSHADPTRDERGVEQAAQQITEAFPDVQALLGEATNAPTRDGNRFQLRPEHHETKRRGRWTLLGSSVKVVVDPSSPNEYDVHARGTRVHVTRLAGHDDELEVRNEGRFLGIQRPDATVNALLFARARSVEELVRWDREEEPPSFTLDLSPGWALHRSVGVPSIVEVRDARNVARLRFRVGTSWDADGSHVAVEPRVEGARIELTVLGEARYPILVDPEWEDTSQPAVEHWGGSSAVLHDGRVLVVGGIGAAGDVAELYDPMTASFSDAGQTNAARERGTATTLLDGSVYIAGGYVTSSGATIASTETFDPRAGTFTPRTPLGSPRAGHSATRLEDGRVLIAGGANFIEVVDTESGETEFLPAAFRTYHSATLLAGGNVLLAGGMSGPDALPLVELFEPGVGLREVGSLLQARGSHSAVRLADGRVLIAGGADSTSYDNPLPSAELYDPTLEGFTQTSPLTIARFDPEAALLPDGRVLHAGGVESSGEVGSTGEVFDPSTGSFATPSPIVSSHPGPFPPVIDKGALIPIAGGRFLHLGRGPALLYDASAATLAEPIPLVESRYGHAVAPLPDGRALVVGGCVWAPTSCEISATAEIVDPSDLASTLTSSPNIARFYGTATPVGSWQILLAGGFDQSGAPVAELELFDPRSEVFSVVGSLVHPRASHTATLLPDGRVMIAGGTTNYAFDPTTQATESIEIFDLDSGQSLEVGFMGAPRLYHTATLLGDGRVLLANGTRSISWNNYQWAGFSALAEADIFDVAKLTTVTIPTAGARFLHVSSALPDGTALLYGGNATPIEIFDPSVDAFETIGVTPGHFSPIGARMISGDVLIGGGAFAQPFTSMLRYAWQSRTFESVGGSLGFLRYESSAVTLATGDVLMVAGLGGPDEDAPRSLQTAELIRDTTVGGGRVMPTISAPSGPIIGGERHALDGSNLTGAFEASGGPVPSPANHPFSVFLPSSGPPVLASSAPFSEVSMTLEPPASAHAGPGWLFPVVAGTRAARGVAVVLERGANATPCNADAACSSGHCEQGVCCSGPCDGPCSSCARAESPGDCAPLEAGLPSPDPLGCPEEAASACGRTGLCGIDGACEVVADGERCAANGTCQAGACILDACRAHSDCPEDLVCTATGACVPLPNDDEVESGCALTAARASGWQWISFVTGLALVSRLLRRRTR